MKNKKELPKLGKKGTVAGLVLSFVAMITLVGAYTFRQYQDNSGNELAELELMEEELAEAESVVEESQEANADQIINEEVTVSTEEETSGEIITAIEEVAISDSSISNEVVNEGVATTNESVASQASFTENSEMVWPIAGNVLMEYSMDDAIYFETLDQYKLNPAMIISGEVGTEVLAAERGTVTNLTIEADTGNTLTIDMGNGYTAVYGQLAELKIEVGDYVEKGQVIGILAEPTKYYSVEGSNLYFEVLNGEVSVDPLNYLIQ